MHGSPLRLGDVDLSEAGERYRLSSEDGLILGALEGWTEEGLELGSAEGPIEGWPEGASEEGLLLGRTLGDPLGTPQGSVLGSDDGLADQPKIGREEG